MKILVLGDDGRAHALVWKLFNSPQASDVICAPGNGGTALLAPQLELNVRNPSEIARWSFDEGVDLIIPASSRPLYGGVVDEAVSFQIGVCGPSQRSTMLEVSRCRAKEFMLRYHLPTPAGRAFDDLQTAEKFLAAHSLPVVVRADSPAVGGGIYNDRYAALTALRDYFATTPLEGTNSGVVIEEYTPGFQVTLSAFTDGTTALPLLPVRLYDQLGPGESGVQAPGMGAFTDTSLYGEKLRNYLHRHIITPLVAGLSQENLPYWGILGIECIIGSQGPRLTAIRCSLRDLEAQVVLPRLDEDLLPIISATIARRLHDLPALRWRQQASIGIGLVAQGYPYHFAIGMPVSGLDALEPGVLVFHSATTSSDGLRYEPLGGRVGGLAGLLNRNQRHLSGGVVTTTGGHVLTLVAFGDTLDAARASVYRNAERVQYGAKLYRKDIGAKGFG